MDIENKLEFRYKEPKVTIEEEKEYVSLTFMSSNIAHFIEFYFVIEKPKPQPQYEIEDISFPSKSKKKTSQKSKEKQQKKKEEMKKRYKKPEEITPK